MMMLRSVAGNARLGVAPRSAQRVGTPATVRGTHNCAVPVRRARRKSFGAPLARTPAGGDGPTNAQIANMYQTALKLSTENVWPTARSQNAHQLTCIGVPPQKINQKNTWSLSLIDHIGELCSGQQAYAEWPLVCVQLGRAPLTTRACTQ